MDELSFLGNAELSSIEELYNKYQSDPSEIDPTWIEFFKGFDFALKNFSNNGINSEALDKEFKVLSYIEAFRKRGHLFTITNPVRTRRKYFPTLALENYDLNEKDLNTEFFAGKEIGIGKTSLKNIYDFLEQTYCKTIGSEYMFIRSPEKSNGSRKR